MPIQEYLCKHCNRVYEFLYATSDDPRRPRCPSCGAEDLERQLAQFAFVRGGKNPLAAIPKTEDEDDSKPRAANLGQADRDPGLYKLWEHAAPEGGDPEAAWPRPRQKHRVDQETGRPADDETD